MNVDIKADWLSNLRSGEYEQGEGILKKNGKFCCLGVLCDMAVKAGVVKETVVEDYDYTYSRYGVDGRTSYLPSEVVSWAGLGNSYGDPKLFGPSLDLPRMNDKGISFTDIANVIEDNL